MYYFTLFKLPFFLFPFIKKSNVSRSSLRRLVIKLRQFIARERACQAERLDTRALTLAGAFQDKGEEYGKTPPSPSSPTSKIKYVNFDEHGFGNIFYNFVLTLF